MYTAAKLLGAMILCIIILLVVNFYFKIDYLYIFIGEGLVLSAVIWVLHSGVLHTAWHFIKSVLILLLILSLITFYICDKNNINHYLYDRWTVILLIEFIVSFILYNLFMRLGTHLGLMFHYREKLHGAWQYELYSGVRSGAWFYFSRLLITIIALFSIYAAINILL